MFDGNEHNFFNYDNAQLKLRGCVFLWEELLKMKKFDLGKEKITKLLFMFSIPCVISMLINSIYNIVDQIFIGQGVGLLGNGATNVIFPLVLLYGAIAGLLGNGCAANISLRLGEGKKEEASKSVGSTITASILFSIIISFVTFVFLPQIIDLFGCTPNVYDYALSYGKIIIVGAPALIVYTVLASIIRADGSPQYSMFFLVIGAVINVILDAIFILGCKWGVEGGAFATIIGQYVSVIIALRYIKRFKNFDLTLKDYKINRSIGKVMLYGISSFITQITVLVLFVFMNNILTKYGAMTKFGEDIPLSSYGIMSKVNSLLISSVLGIAIGAQPIIGFNYGAGNKERVKEALKKIYFVNMTIGIVFNLIYLLFPAQLVSIFGSTDNPLYIEFSIKLFRTFLMINFINSFEMTTSIIIQSLGNAKKAAACTFIRQIILFIPSALIFAHFFGLNGILYAGPTADFLCFILVLFLFMSEYKKLGTLGKDSDSLDDVKIEGKKGLVITINREYASGGRYVGKLLAKELNIPFYDKEIISLTAKESGFTQGYIKKNEQKKSTLSSEYNRDDEIFIAESKVIRNISKKSGVIVGRCADYVLKDVKNVYKIFLYSDIENKIKRATKYYGIDKKDASDILSQVDKQRERHYKYYTSRNWREFDNYDLAINVDTLGAEKTAILIKNIIKSNKK